MVGPSTSVYPTPTSLESLSSPKHFISIPRTVLPATADVLGLPLLLGRVERRTARLAARRGRRRTRTRKEVETVGMTEVRKRENRCSFGPDFNSEIGGKEERVLIGLPNSFFEVSSYTKTDLIKRLLSKVDSPGSFNSVHVSTSTRLELEASLATVFYPVCLKYNASIDTAFLAYEILARYCKVLPPRTFAIRSQLYIAALMIAFKFNEEEDPVVAEFGATILKSKHCPVMFNVPTTPSVLRMEQKLMKIIEWRVTDILTPIIFTYSLLDCFPDIGWDRKAKRQLAKKTEMFLDGYLSAATSRHPCFSVVRWTVFALAHILAISTPRQSVEEVAARLWNVLYPADWKDPLNPPNWYLELTESCTLRFERPS